MRPTDITEPPAGSGCRKVVYAKDQPQYQPLPALAYSTGEVFSLWELTENERRAILDGARIELWQYPFGRPLQPINLRVEGVEEPAISEGLRI